MHSPHVLVQPRLLLILITSKKVLNYLMQRLGRMFSHVSQDILNGNSRLLSCHTCVRHYQEDNVAYRYIVYLLFPFHNNSF